MLRVERLTKVFENSTDQIAGGIREASFALEPGTFFTLLGPSGCGKTTTLALHRRPRDAGRRRRSRSTAARCSTASAQVNVPVEQRAVGMVFQSYAIWPHMTVAENVAFPLTVTKHRRYSRGRDRGRRSRKALGDRRSRRLPGAAGAAALRRPAAARGAGARGRARAAAAAARRAALQSRRPAARRDAQRAQAPAKQDRHHHRLRHPRPVGGAGAVRPDRGDRPGPHPADRLAAGHLFPAGQSVRRALRRRHQPAGRPADRRRQRPRRRRGARRIAPSSAWSPASSPIRRRSRCRSGRKASAWCRAPAGRCGPATIASPAGSPA